MNPMILQLMTQLGMTGPGGVVPNLSLGAGPGTGAGTNPLFSGGAPATTMPNTSVPTVNPQVLQFPERTQPPSPFGAGPTEPPGTLGGAAIPGGVGAALSEAWNMLQEAGPYQSPASQPRGPRPDLTLPSLAQSAGGAVSNVANTVAPAVRGVMDQVVGGTQQLGQNIGQDVSRTMDILAAPLGLPAGGVGMPNIPLGPDGANAMPGSSISPVTRGTPQALGTPSGPGAPPTIPGQGGQSPVDPAMAGKEALRAIQDPDGVAAEQAATGAEPPSVPGTSPQEGIGGQLAQMAGGMNDALAAVKPVESPPLPSAPGAPGLGGQINPQLLQMLMSMQPQGKVGPSLAELLARA